MRLGGEMAALLACAAAMTVNLVVHLLTYRTTERYVHSAILGFAAGLIVLAIGEVLRFTAYPVGLLEGLVTLAGDLAIYGCAAFLFFNFINAGESSIRIRILRELRAMDRPLTVTALLKAYNDFVILDTRLGRMISNHQIEYTDGRYRLVAHTLLRPAKLFRFLKWLLLRRTSEFDEGRSGER
jgi:hypothetical protein